MWAAAIWQIPDNNEIGALVARLLFMLVFGCAMVAAFVVIIRRPKTLLAKIQIALTALVIVVFLVEMKIAFWLHSMAYADPVRQAWQPKFAVIGSVMWFGAIGSWLLFTLFHVAVALRRKTHPKESA